MSRRAKTGDIVEITTATGKAYVQLIHRHRLEGELLRALPGMYSKPPDLARLAEQEERFLAFYPLDAAIKAKLVEVVGNEEIPARLRAFPRFRYPHRDWDGRIQEWSIWDGEELEPIGPTLKEEHAGLPLYPAIWNHGALIHHIERGWRSVEEGPAEDQQAAASEPHGTVRHFLYFPDRVRSASAAKEIQQLPFEVDIDGPSDDKGEWLVLVTAPPTDPEFDLDRQSEQLRRVAEAHGGEYDGWEARV